MNDKADVRFVDAHAEGVRCDHDGLAVEAKIVLIGVALFFGESCVVACGGNALIIQKFAHALNRSSSVAVDNAGLSVPLAHKLQRCSQLARRVLDGKIEVRTVEARDVEKRVPEPQLRDDIRTHLLCRGGREGGDDGTCGELHDKVGNFQVAGPEILPPLRDAVSLVDGEKRHGNVRNKRQKALVFEPLRRDIQKLILLACGFGVSLPQLLERQGAIEKGRRNARLRERRDLVLHE